MTGKRVGDNLLLSCGSGPARLGTEGGKENPLPVRARIEGRPEHQLLKSRLVGVPKKPWTRHGAGREDRPAPCDLLPIAAELGLWCL